MAKLVFEYFCK